MVLLMLRSFGSFCFCPTSRKRHKKAKKKTVTVTGPCYKRKSNNTYNYKKHTPKVTTSPKPTRKFQRKMDNYQRSPLLGWAYFFQGKSMEELRTSLLYTTLELENTKLAVQEELRKRDDQLTHLKDMLTKALTERDEAQEKCQRLLLEKLFIQQQKQLTRPLSGISSIDDEPRRGIDSNNGISSSDCEESIVSSPVIDPIRPPLTQLGAPPPQQSQQATTLDELVIEKPLPEKGKLLQAVMKAGPLLQTLLLAGPLPQWRHPPPPLESFEIPPVTISSQPHQDSLHLINTNCGRVNRKRLLCEGSDSPSAEAKLQRVLLH